MQFVRQVSAWQCCVRLGLSGAVERLMVKIPMAEQVKQAGRMLDEAGVSMSDMLDDMIGAWLGDKPMTALDGCVVAEPDGVCQHGYMTWATFLEGVWRA